jgi:cytochrome c oxidase subunit 4
MSLHVVPVRIYASIFAALLVLTAATVFVAYLDLGPLNDVLALTIAVAKSTLVVLFFMHVRYATRLTGLTVLSGIFWLVILIALTMNDYASRGWLGVPGK